MEEAKRKHGEYVPRPRVKPTRTRSGKWIRFGICLALAVLVLLVAFFGEQLAPYDPLETDFAAKLSPPSKEHFFGTDKFGRDIFVRVFYGTRISLFVGVLSAILCGGFGIIYGQENAGIGRAGGSSAGCL